MADFIRDVRQDLDVPQMPFVIGVMGVGGDQATGGASNIRQAMAAPAEMPEFKGNVAAVQTAPYWDKPLAKIEDKMGQVKKMSYYLGKNEPNNVRRDPVAAEILDKYMGSDGKITREQIKSFGQEYRAQLITSEEEAMWKRGASNAGYHYLGCAKTLALVGQALAKATLEMEKQ